MTAGRATPGSTGGGRWAARVKRVLGLFLTFVNPGAALRIALAETSAVLAISVSGAAFGLLFLQTGLDLARAGQPTLPLLGWTGPAGVIGLTLVGLFYGTLGIWLLAVVAFVATRPFGATLALGPTVRAMALGYSPALFYVLLGLAANVFLGWNTAVAFGVTGLLWALGPMIGTLRAMLDGRTGIAVILATLLGGLMLFGWAFLGT